jgi:transaldolase
MKIFLDTANRELIKKWIPTGLIDGVTTNPSHMSKEGSDTKAVLRDICDMVQGPVSIEVIEKKPEAVYEQAKEIAKFAPNVVVKIPCLPEYMPIIHRLVQEGVKLNITLVFSEIQALLVAKLGVTYISPFVGRLDDIGLEGSNLIDELVIIKQNYNFSSQILAASIRTVYHWHRAAVAGADVVTLPPAVLEQGMKHPLTDRGVELFDNDWKKLNKPTLW